MIVLGERLEREVEKGCRATKQTGFRREIGAMNNVYVLNYLVNRQLSRAKGKDGGLIRGPKSGV